MRKFISRFLLLLVPTSLLFFSATCFAGVDQNADEWNYAQPIGEKCFEPGADGVPVGQLGANFCMSNALQQADAQMNAIYKELVSILAEARLLRESQRAWLKFRDLECKLRTSGMGEGSATQFVVGSCNLDLTLKRIKDLQHLRAGLDCIGCPVTR